MQTLDAKCFLDALNRAIEFQRKQPMNGVGVVIALTEVKDAVRFAINDEQPIKRKRSARSAAQEGKV